MATPPTAAVERAASLLPPGDALDIACGAGRHAIWLSAHAWKVTAVDHNADAIAQLRARHPAIDARVVDLEAEPLPMPPSAYDLVICWLYFQRDLYPAIHSTVRPGGIAALSALLQGRFAAKPEELQTFFPGWTILHAAETAHSPEKRSTELIVRRPAL